ncbi:MAG: hypothetical protein AABX52_02380 [Nanoarchaeota archaeon]
MKGSIKITPKVVEQVISEVAGKDTLKIVKALKGKKNISEFKLAHDIAEEINTTRNMLYRLYNANLVSFTRKKDKTKGWYIYYWTFNTPRVKDLVGTLKKKRLDMLRERLDREKASHFYACLSRCIRLDFEQATDFGYKCPECGKLLNQEDNTDIIINLEKEIGKIKNSG